MRRSGVFFGMVVVLLAAGWAPASNMAFAFRLNLGVAGQELRFIALPYDVTPGTAEALCEDLGGDEAVAEVLRWDEATSRFVVHTCGSVTQDFSLEEGMAYGVRSAAGNAIDALLVGMHDQSFTLELAPTTGSNMSWISPPYHMALVDLGGQEGVVDAEDLCLAIGKDTVFAVVRWDGATGAYEVHICGSEFDEGFALTVGEGYGLVNAEGQTISWQPAHY